VSTRSDHFAPQIAALLLGSALALLPLTIQPGRALLRSAGISIGWAAKLREAPAGGVPPRYYQLPEVPIGDSAWRRSGPVEVWANVLADYLEYSGVEDHPYHSLAPVRVSYGPLGFRDELPAKEGGIAMVGSSYLEAGFAGVEDTIPGQLQARHGRPAANFGMSFARPEDVLAHLEYFVLPTRPEWVVWVISERLELGDVEDPRVAKSFEWALRGRARDFLRGWIGSFSDSISRRLGERAKSPASVGIYRFLCRYRAAGHDIQVHCPPPPPAAEVTRSIAALRPAVSQAGERIAQSGAGLLVVMVPTLVRTLDGVIEPAEPSERARFREGASVHPLDNGVERLGEMVRALGSLYLDLTPALSAAAARGVLTNNPILDRHLNADGMAIAADEIARTLDLAELRNRASDEGSGRIAP
jgi:hypothetical protein